MFNNIVNNKIIIGCRSHLLNEMTLEDFNGSALYCIFVEAVNDSRSKTKTAIKKLFVKYANLNICKEDLKNNAIYILIKEYIDSIKKV